MKILIVEDEAKVARALAMGLEELGYECETAGNGLEGLQVATKTGFDIVILDINLPQMNGIELCQRLRQNDKRVKIIMLTAMGGLDHKLLSFEYGADDYLVKPFEFLELAARIKLLSKRVSEEVPSEVLTAADLTLDTYAKSVHRAGNRITLTAKEFSLLEYLIRNKGRVVSRLNIAEHVWDINFETGTNVIDVYINFLRKKIDKNYEPKLIHTLVGMGYILKDAD